MTRRLNVSRLFPLLTLLIAGPLVAVQAFVAYDLYIKDDAPGDGWKTYRHERFKYEFRYPPDWVVTENREPQPGDDFLTQLVVMTPKSVSGPNRRSAPHVMA